MNPTDPECARAQAQRRQSIACAALSLVVTLALVASNFKPEPQVEQARAAVRAHRQMLEQSQQVLARNTAELSQDQATLESLRKTARP
jgi:multidrug resistance efflux pump